jgi:ferredoxin-NADP reductase
VTWSVATVLAHRDETPTARTLRLAVDGWAGHIAGQHVDVRLTAPDGYQAARSYSIASAPTPDTFEITVQRLPDGEVSSYLTEGLDVGHQVEIRGPLGGWFVWRAEQREPVQLVAGGSGVVPLMSMVRTRAAVGSGGTMRLLYSVRDPESALYRDELDGLGGAGVPVSYAYTRSAPADWSGTTGRLDEQSVAAAVISPSHSPTCYVCGPTPFVETVAELLVRGGHDPRRVRTERFGGAEGGTR